ncbi:UNVERIFIED_ORG: hypothetical protein EDC92_12030 [Dietzia maris]|uniref:hypothetical protein n=1 Tax=Dietzia maris TaxID=37915 RepID=UPI0010E3F604
MGALGVILTSAAAVMGSVAVGVGGWSLVATAANNDGIWNGLPIQLQGAIRDAGLAPGR